MFFARHRAVLLRMAFADASRRPWRLGLLASGIALACAASFGALVFQSAIDRSLDHGLARFGADAAILPGGVTANLTPVILTVEPGSGVLPHGAVSRLGALPAVGKIAPQRTLKVADIGGHLPMEIVVFDANADLTVLPWVVEALDRPLGVGDVIVGGRRPEKVGERILFQGVELTIHSRLGLAGAGPFERSLFISSQTADLLAQGGVLTADGTPFPNDPLGTPSGALIRLKSGFGPEELRFGAASEPGVVILTGPGSQIGVRQAVEALLGSSLAILALALVAPAVLVGVAYTGILAERRRELGILLALGVGRLDILLMVVLEAGLTAIAGGFAGIVAAMIVMVLFLRTIGFALEQRSIPLVFPNIWECIGYGVGSGVAVAITAVMGASLACWIASAQSVWNLLRGEES